MNNAIFTPPPTPGYQKPSATAAELERLSSAIPAAINDRDFSFTSPLARDLLHHLSPDFRSDLDTQASHLNWSEQVLAWQERAEEFPDVRFETEEVTSNVDEESGMGSVFMQMTVTGIGDVQLQAVNELRFERHVDGRWMLYHTVGMRGSPGNSGVG